MKHLGAVLLLTLSALAQGTFTTYTTTWNNLTRTYSVYVPPNLQTTPAMVMALHGTTIGSNPPLTYCMQGMGWNTLANTIGFLLVCPIATYKAIGSSGEFFWEAYNTASYFPAPPDDSGFLRSLVLAMQQPQSAGGYGVDPNRVFVTGMSSGGMMAQRVGIDSSDLVAAIAPASGPVWVGTSTLPNPLQAISVIEFHGDNDVVIPYCGGVYNSWGERNITIPSVDVDVNYWLAADLLGPNPAPLCSSNQPTPNAYQVDFRSTDGLIEVEFVRELGVCHCYQLWVSGMVWGFFETHTRGL